MIREELKEVKIQGNALRNFGITMGIALPLLMGIIYLSSKNLYIWMTWLAVGFLVLGFLIPKSLIPIYYLWMWFSVVLGFVMSRVILSILFFLIVTPLSLTLRLFGKKFLELKWNKEASSYWIIREDNQNDPLRYDKQY